MCSVGHPAHRLLHVVASPLPEHRIWVSFLLVLLPDTFVGFSLVFVHIKMYMASTTQSSVLQKGVAPKANVEFEGNL